jgi:hypothetical protein
VARGLGIRGAEHLIFSLRENTAPVRFASFGRGSQWSMEGGRK